MSQGAVSSQDEAALSAGLTTAAALDMVTSKPHWQRVAGAKAALDAARDLHEKVETLRLHHHRVHQAEG